MRRTIGALLIGCVLFVACGVEDVESVVAASPIEPSNSVATASVESSVVSVSPSEAPPPSDDSSTPDAGPLGIAEWIAASDIEVIDQRDTDGTWRVWLLRVDDDDAIALASALAVEAHKFDITDEDGMLEAMRSGRWLRDCPSCIQMDLDPDVALDFVINGGLFGVDNPNPASPDGSELSYSSLPGELGSEPSDQIDYLVGSELHAGPYEWESVIVDLLPALGAAEFIAAIEFRVAR